MATPGMTAPVVSETVPVSVPRSVCANAARADRSRQTKTDSRRTFMANSSTPKQFLGFLWRDCNPALDRHAMKNNSHKKAQKSEKAVCASLWPFPFHDMLRPEGAAMTVVKIAPNNPVFDLPVIVGI